MEFGNISSAIASKPDNLTVASHLNVNVTGNTIPNNGIYLPSGNTLGFATNATLWWEIAATGGLSNIAPSSGTALVVNAAAGSAGLVINAAASNDIAVTLAGNTVSNAILNLNSVGAFAGIINVGNANASASLLLKVNSTTALTIAQGGNVTIAAPSGGLPLVINHTGAGMGLQVASSSGNSAYIYSDSNSAGIFAASTILDGLLAINAGNVAIYTNGNPRLSVAQTGAVTINATTSGNSLTVNGANSAYASQVNGGSGSGISFGFNCLAGTTSADACAQFTNQSGGTVFAKIFGDGGVTVGTPTGGDKGAATLNVASGIFQNGVNIVQSGTFTGTLTGCTTGPTATFNYNIVNGTVVTIDCSAGLTGTSNTTSMTITGVAAACTPARTQQQSGPMENASAFLTGFQQVSGTTISFGAGVSGMTGGFTASNTKGIPAGWSMTYALI